MRKFIAIALAVLMVFAVVACSQVDTADTIKAEFESYDWDAANVTMKKAEAERLLSKYEMLPEAEQTTIADVKLQLDRYAKAEDDANPTPSPSPTPDSRILDPNLEDPILGTPDMENPDLETPIKNDIMTR